MDQHQTLVEVEGNAVGTLPDVFEGVKENIVSVLVISKLLLLLSDINSNLDSLLHIANSAIELECPLGLLWLIVNLAQQVIY